MSPSHTLPMSRPKRIDLPFSLYHVISRTNSGDIAFHDHRDQGTFFDYLSQYAEMFHYRIHCYCLMENHFHLLLESHERAMLSEVMHRLLTAYTIYFNRRYGRRGHLFQGRFKSYLVEKAEYLLALSRYIHLNPIHTNTDCDPFSYLGSSLRYYIKGGEPAFLYTKEILSWFRNERKRYARFVKEGLVEKDKLEIYQQRFIGGRDFARRIYQRLTHQQKKGTRSRKSPEENRERLREEDENRAGRIVKSVAEYFGIQPELVKSGIRAGGATGKARAVLIALLRNQMPWTGKRIGEYIGIKREIYYYLRKVEGNKNQTQAFKTLSNIKYDGV